MLKATPSASRQLPREGAMYGWDSCSREKTSAESLLSLLRYPSDARKRLPLEGAGSRRRRETEGVAFGRSAARQSNKPCSARKLPLGRTATRQRNKSCSARKSPLGRSATRQRNKSCSARKSPLRRSTTRQRNIPHSAKPQTIQSIPTQTKHPTHTNIYYLLCIISYLLSKIYQDSGLQ